jgi:hypothetical protein
MKKIVPIVVLALTMLAPVVAAAHAGAPLARRVQIFGDGTWSLRTNFGVISSDAPNSFVCEEAFLGGDRFFVAALAPSRYVTFAETSIQRTTDGCEFERVGTPSGRIEDVDSNIDGELYAYVSNGEGGGVYLSRDDGAGFESVGDVDTSVYQLTTVRFLDPTTLVVGAYDRENDGAAAIFAVDIDANTTTPLTLPDGLSYPYVIAAGGGRLVFNARSMVQTVFVGTLDDPAMHTREQLPGESWPTGAAVSNDGSRIYLAGMVLGLGVQVAEWSDTELVWESMLDTEPVGCVNDRDGAVLLCSSVASGGNGDLVSLDATTTTPVVTFSEITGPRDCPADSDVGTVCPLVWPEVAPALGVEGFESPPDAGNGADAGEIDAGTNLPNPDDAPIEESGTCSAVGAGPSGFSLLILLIAARARRRRNES